MASARRGGVCIRTRVLWRCRLIPFDTAPIGWRPAGRVMPPIWVGPTRASVVGCGDRAGRSGPDPGDWAIVDTPELADGAHVGEVVVFPATGFIDVMLRAGERPAARLSMSWCCTPRWCWSSSPPTDLQVMVQPAQEVPKTARAGRLPCTRGPAVSARCGMDVARHRCVESRPARGAGPAGGAAGCGAHRRRQFLCGVGRPRLRYGGLFRSLRGVGPTRATPMWCTRRWGCRRPDIAGYGVHPAMLDAALHALAAWF